MRTSGSAMWQRLLELAGDPLEVAEPVRVLRIGDQHAPSHGLGDHLSALAREAGLDENHLDLLPPRLTDEQIWQLVGYLRTFGQTSAPSQPTGQPAPGAATAQPQAQPPQQFSAQVPNVQEPLPPIVFARQGNIWRSLGDGSEPQPITKLPNETYAEYPTVAPNGGTIAFVAIAPAPITATLPLPSSTLYTMGADGANLRAIWKPEQGLLGMPTWSADGKTIYIAANGVKLVLQSSASPPSVRELQSCGSTWRQAPSKRC